MARSLRIGSGVLNIARMWLQAASVWLVLLGAAVAQAHGVKTKTIEIVHPWTYETAGVEPVAPEPVASVYMKIKNRGRQSDRLLAAVTTRAAAVELRGAPLPGSGATQRVPWIEIKAGEDVELLPSGVALQMSGVKKAFPAYDTFTMTLTFERAGKIEIEVLVEEGTGVAPHKH